MKICCLLGSPRKNGNTAEVLKIFCKEAKKLGYETEIINLIDKNFSGCMECFQCQKVKNKPGCVLKDDMDEIYEKILNSDCIIIATPVFCWSFSWVIKKFLDRTFCFDKYNEDGSYVSIVEGKKIGIILTAAGDEFDGADLVIEGYLRMVEYHKMKDIGRICVCGILKKEDILKRGVEIKEKIRNFLKDMEN
jgi:multimeric flavodoxin WrbA